MLKVSNVHLTQHRISVRVLEEDHAGTWTSQGLVGGGRDHIAVLERTGMFSGRHKATDVSNVCHQNGTHLVNLRHDMAQPPQCK